MDINRNLATFLSGEGKSRGLLADERYASFDYCYNYFQSFRERNAIPDLASPDNIQISCLQIGFYLASWGMLRGSSFLLQKSVRHFQPLIECVVSLPRSIWNIDADQYTDNNIDALLECAQMIGTALGQEHNPSPTLVTKIMLGIFGSIPAFDSYFRRGFGVHNLGHRSLRKIAQFCFDHHETLDGYKIRTLDFSTGQPTHRIYPKAKLIDMIFFVEGGGEDSDGEVEADKPVSDASVSVKPVSSVGENNRLAHKFVLTVQKAYYDSGFFNVPVAVNKYVRQTDGSIPIILVSTGQRIVGRISHRANPNGTARVYGNNALRDWLQQNCRILDHVEVDLSDPDEIRIKKLSA